jgi:hypothetical protein
MTEDVGGLGDVLDDLGRRVQERPYAVLGLAAAAGYVLGGGLFSPLTRPLARMAMGALLVPGFRERVRGIASEWKPAQGEPATGLA